MGLSEDDQPLSIVTHWYDMEQELVYKLMWFKQELPSLQVKLPISHSWILKGELHQSGTAMT